ncbi:hypothetical protein LAZ67_23000262 [Cordylochernes scorpioides]|uniref:Pro-Pol polyprotein n=1 Tax=Cordylochernes scorpioides TaxID=51811 RepID=A0ABY6LQ65_9ARAC|nr:hypothetical protein LAZ67_23000262 [Cordylochernes scorpioides]
MDKLKRERTPLRNTITRTTNEIKSGLSLKEVDIILIRAKFERLTILNDKLILIDDKIKEILLDDPRSTEAQINDEMELCETYSLQVGIVAQKVKEYESKLAAPCDDKMSQFSTSDVKRQIKLPKFELKKYTGELEEWLSWWSHFEKIHLDESLSDVDKFEYLIQSMVVGSKAHRLVTSFPLTQKNYNKVIGDLKDRFGDRDMLTELYVRKLLKLVIASARSEKRTLAQLYDDLVAHLHSLGSLGVDTKSGGGAFLYPLVESSLPLELIKIWQRSRTPYIEAGIEHSGAKAFDKLEGLIEFLKQEVKNAERISFVAEGFEPSLPLKQGKRENNPPKIHTASALFVGKTNLPCLFCDKDNHLSQNCFKAAKMLESDRLKRVQDAKVCFKCLRKNHLKKDCRSFVRCKRCQGPHFEIMCRGTSHSQENLNWRPDNRSHNSLAEQNEGNSEPVTAMANQVCTNNISLMTLIVKLKGPKRSKMVRVLLDSGSQKSYIRRSLAKELDLPKVGEVKLKKCLFGGQTTGEKAHSIFYFQLDNVDEGKAFKMEALEETIICGNILPVETGPRQWELDKKGITLTKVDNNKTEIDILIGGDYYGQLLTGKIEQLAGGLTAIQTVLGWTLIGNTSSERPETSAQMVITLLATQPRVTSLWELETIGIQDPTEVISEKEKNVLMQEKFHEKICRGHDERYPVSLPWKEGIRTIPNNLEIAEKVLIRSTQRDSLGKGQISHLKTKVQSDGLMYIETKLLYDQSPEEFRKPVLLPCDHPITEQLIREMHSNNCHAGVHVLLSKLREKFWILKARKTIKRVVRGCIICRRHAEKANTIPCAPLPKDRLFMGRPFEVTGVDLMGLLYLKNGQKIWITLFTCAVYRAVHLELVEGLDATNFIMALERFIHRRGRPVKIYSDNGTNFKRTNRLFTNLNWDKLARYSCDKQIRWIFIPPSAPWWGGWWEQLVRLVKDLLRRTLGTKRVNYVQLETLICHVEAIINTRPLTYISETEDDLIPITPQMFIQNNFGSFDESHELSPDNTRQHFRKLQQIMKELKERFHKEYLAMLVQKGNETEGRRFLPGEVVLIGRDDQKRIFWPLGRILELYPGKDGRERVARVRTATGEFVRPLKRLFSLELGSDISREVRLPKTEGIKAQEIPTDGEQSIFTRSGREVKKPTRLGVYTNNLS